MLFAALSNSDSCQIGPNPRYALYSACCEESVPASARSAVVLLLLTPSTRRSKSGSSGLCREALLSYFRVPSSNSKHRASEVLLRSLWYCVDLATFLSLQVVHNRSSITLWSTLCILNLNNNGSGTVHGVCQSSRKKPFADNVERRTTLAL
jgi:hypothetical protein